MPESQKTADELKDESLTFTLSDKEINEIAQAVQSQDSDTVHAVLEDLSPADTAELVAKFKDDDRNELLVMYGEAIDPEVFTEMDPELRRSTLSAMPPDQIASLISELDSDDALELIRPLDDRLQKEIIQRLSAKSRVALEEGLSFPEDSAGRLMQREIVAVPLFWTAGKTIDYLRAAGEDLPEEFFDIFVIDPAYHVRGQVPLNRLIRSKRAEKLEDLAETDVTTIPATMDQEEVAHLFRRDDLVSAPVIDENGRLIGVITIDDIVDVIDEEAQEDIMKMAGVERSDLYRAVLSTTGTRFRWLFINLLTAILASIVISFFDATIEQIVALAVLMPIVASMGGNAGTQALTVAVRALATKELSGANRMRVIWKETLVGTLNGAAFAVITGLVAALWFSNPMLGIVIAAAMIINLFAAGLCGAAIPILLDRYGSDPAVSSTVFLTTVTDVVGFFAFLGLAAILLL
ncbi:MAG: magnesium transporter [Alphaproteobacteria bacterium]|nr:magnesium transporter [Alphaproteobacteria bacterium]